MSNICLNFMKRALNRQCLLINPIINNLCPRLVPNRTLSAMKNPNMFDSCKLASIQSPNYILYRNKTRKREDEDREEEEDSDSEGDDAILKKWATEDKALNKISKVVCAKPLSNRLDHIIKAGLNISRNKIEVMFYESKIRVNGEKATKKSVVVDAGDEVDVIKSYNKTNPQHLDVARLEILEILPKVDKIHVIMRRYKNITIENYDSPFTGNIE